MLNISYRKVGGLRFLKLGRLTFMWCLSRQYKPLPNAGSRRRSQRPHAIQLRFAHMPESNPAGFITYSGE